MPAVVNVAVHPSLFPEAVQRELLQALHARNVPPKFHYTSYKQAQKWLALHEAYSPSRTDDDCAAQYDRSFAAAGDRIGKAVSVHVVGLGCGGGQKEARLLERLAGQGRELTYTPCDVSLPLILTSLEAAPGVRSYPLVCDLNVADDLKPVLDEQANAADVRVFTFFGMIPNMEPEGIMPKLRGLLRPRDWLLFSANLAPGTDYAAGVRQVFAGYNNPQSSDWLITFLYDLGVEQGDGALRFSIEDAASSVKRIVADYHFAKPRKLRVHGEDFAFQPGDVIRLFFSYRYTPALAASLLSRHGLRMADQWIAQSGDEGIFLCQT
jgi:uncharacterized SAM-dependent methyltransferase